MEEKVPMLMDIGFAFCYIESAAKLVVMSVVQLSTKNH